VIDPRLMTILWIGVVALAIQSLAALIRSATEIIAVTMHVMG
jgi:hypothetical protein